MRNKRTSTHVDATTAVQNVDDSRTPCRSSPKNKLNISKRVKTNSSKLENPRELLAIDVQQTDHRKNAKDSRRNIKDINQESSSQLEFTIARNGKAVDEKFASSAVTLTKENLEEYIKEENAFIENTINSLPHDVFFNSEVLEQIKGIRYVQQDNFEGLRRNSKDLLRSNKLKSDLIKRATITEIITELGKTCTHQSKKSGIMKQRSASIIELKARLNEKIAKLRGSKMKVHVDRRTSEKKRERNKNNDKSKKKFEFKIDKDAPLVTENEKVAEMPTTQAVFNTDGKMVFSRFDFSESGIPQQRTGEYSGKDYKKLLKKSTKDQEKIRKLEQIDQAKADNVKNKKKWKAALERAQGIKVKDDPVLLKKGMKRTQQRHKKSKKKWDERVEFIKQKQEKKQKKRMENIQARKKEKTAKKIKRSLKKGRLIPGFS